MDDEQLDDVGECIDSVPAWGGRADVYADLDTELWRERDSDAYGQ